MTKEEIFDRYSKRVKSINNSIEAYRDYLDIQKSFFGEDFPMIVKFENLLNRFERMVKDQLDEITCYHRILADRPESIAN